MSDNLRIVGMEKPTMMRTKVFWDENYAQAAEQVADFINQTCCYVTNILQSESDAILTFTVFYYEN